MRLQEEDHPRLHLLHEDVLWLVLHNLLDCGHACGITCHDEDCRTLLQQRKEELLKQGIEISEGGCTQSCGVSREACGHPCEALCHPHKPCPLEPCKYMINITCACGKPFLLREQN
jgi:hypothetical protein